VEVMAVNNTTIHTRRSDMLQMVDKTVLLVKDLIGEHNIQLSDPEGSENADGSGNTRHAHLAAIATMAAHDMDSSTLSNGEEFANWPSSERRTRSAGANARNLLDMQLASSQHLPSA
jgi:hypothetical protein